MLRAARLLLAVVLLCGSLLASGPFVRREGRRLVTPDAKPLLLRGINLGNWLVPEGYMWQLDRGAASAREIERLLNELVGPEEAARFWTRYRDHYITADDIEFIRQAGFNSVRVPLHYRFFLDSDEGFVLLDRVVAWCRKAGLYVILDLHAAPGGQTGTNIDDSWGYPWLFESPRAQQETITVWRRLAAHYADEPAVLGYDLLNEPIPTYPSLKKYNDRLEPLYKRLAEAIRAVDKNHVLIIEGAQWASNFAVLGPPFDDNVLYSFHKYWTAPERSVIEDYIAFRERHNVPLWLGESGENEDKWIEQFSAMLEANDIGWCFWPYKKMDNTASPVAFARPKHWDAIAAYAEVPGTSGATESKLPKRPSIADAREALEDLLDKVRLANCRVNEGYLRALRMKVPVLPEIR